MKKINVALLGILGSVVVSHAFAATTTTSTTSTPSSSNTASAGSPMQALANAPQGSNNTTAQSTPSAQPAVTAAAATAVSAMTATANDVAASLTPTVKVVDKNAPTANSALSAGIPASIDCSYSFSEAAAQIDPNLVTQWASNAVLQTFTYDFQNYDKEFKVLKGCYTTTGWDSYNEAMKVSNNLKAVQDEHLFVTAKVSGESQLVSQSMTDSQPAWMIRVPLTVTYQNQDRDVTQDLYVDVTVKTVYGVPMRLGINQIIASPRVGAANVMPASATPVSNTTTNAATTTTTTTTSANK